MVAAKKRRSPSQLPQDAVAVVVVDEVDAVGAVVEEVDAVVDAVVVGVVVVVGGSAELLRGQSTTSSWQQSRCNTRLSGVFLLLILLCYGCCCRCSLRK